MLTKPDGGSHRRDTAKRSSRRMPSQKVGIASAIAFRSVIARLIGHRGRTADRMPKGVPRPSMTIIVPTAK
jgi:hypothetical protein